MADLNRVVAESARCYSILLQWLDERCGHLSDMAPDEVIQMAAQFKELQAAAEEADRRLDPFLEQAGAEAPEPDLWQERSRLIAAAHEKNRTLTREIMGRQAVVGSELAHLRKGQAALGGYRGGASTRGANIGGNY